MEYYCDVCDKTIKIKFKRKQLQGLTQKDLGKCQQKTTPPEILIFFDIDELCNNYITNHKKNFELHLIKSELKLLFDGELYPHIESEVRINLSKFHFKKSFFLL